MNGLARRLAAMACIMLTGCEVIWMNSEEKINAAFPVSPAVATGIDGLLRESAPDLRKKLEAEYAGKLKLRAITCAKGYSPSRFTSLDSVRSNVNDPACFTSADAGIFKWIGMRRVAGMLAAGPLRPIPATAPKYIIGDAFIQSAEFAKNAGVALLHTQQSLLVVDMEKGKTLFKEPRTEEQLGTLSSNGRLFITSAENKVKIRSAETGALIHEVPKARAYAFQWADRQSALYNSSENGKVFLIDFARGEEIPVPEIQGPFNRVVSVDDQGSTFLIGTHRTAIKAAIERSAQETKFRLIDEKPISGGGWALNTSGLTAGGDRWFSTNKDLTITALATLAQEKISLDPLHIQTAVATAEPDTLLLKGFVQGLAEARMYLYSLSERTVAPIDRSQLMSERVVHIPSLKAQAVIADSKIVLIDVLPVGEAISEAKFVANLAEEVNQRKLEAFQRSQTQPELQAYPAPLAAGRGQWGIPAAAIPNIPGPYAELAKDAQIESIGVYQGPRPSATGSRKEGVIDVRVRKSPKPILLVLASYEAVQWSLHLEPGARLAGVLVSGYKTSRVNGNGAARVLMMGGQYAYKLDSSEYNALNLTVQRLTGKPIYYFQGRYEGAAFEVGGA